MSNCKICDPKSKFSNCICPECIIHGIHKDHDVKTLKKAYPIIKN